MQACLARIRTIARLDFGRMQEAMRLPGASTPRQDLVVTRFPVSCLTHQCSFCHIQDASRTAQNATVSCALLMRGSAMSLDAQTCKLKECRGCPRLRQLRPGAGGLGSQRLRLLRPRPMSGIRSGAQADELWPCLESQSLSFRVRS